MFKIRDEVDLKELEKFGFMKDKIFQIINRPIYEDYLEQFKKREYLLIHPVSKVLVKGKQCCVLDLQGNSIIGYDIKTNRIKRYVQDIIQAGLVEKV